VRVPVNDRLVLYVHGFTSVLQRVKTLLVI
jgi:hypothetical protein